jgi:hypothetical protein
MSETKEMHVFPNEYHDGITLRDYFARGAMQELMRDGSHPNVYNLARSAYTVADAMLAVRTEGE